MKKILIGLSLAGILALGSNLSAFEINEKGFPVPDKTNMELDAIEINVFKDATLIKSTYYPKVGSGGFIEFGTSDRTWLYSIWSSADRSDLYIIEDKNCDGVFETKYRNEELNINTIINIKLTDCYKKNPNEK